MTYQFQELPSLFWQILLAIGLQWAWWALSKTVTDKIYFFIRRWNALKSKPVDSNDVAIASADRRARKLIKDNPKVAELYKELQKHPYRPEYCDADRNNNAYRSLVQARLRRVVKDKVVRVSIYNMAG